MKEIDKKEAKRPDLFLKAAHRVWAYIVEHQKAFMIGTAVAVITAAVSITIQYRKISLEKEAQSAFYEVQLKYQKLKEDYAKAEKPKVKELAAEASKDKDGDKMAQTSSEPKTQAATGDLDKDYGSVVAGFDRVISEYPQSQGAVMASLQLVEILRDYGKLDRALKRLQETKNNVAVSDLMFGLHRFAMANLMADLEQCEQAIPVWQNLVDNANQSHLHAESLLRQGLCYQALNDLQKATNIFQKIRKDFSESDEASSAQKYLIWMNFKKKPQAS